MDMTRKTVTFPLMLIVAMYIGIIIHWRGRGYLHPISQTHASIKESDHSGNEHMYHYGSNLKNKTYFCYIFIGRLGNHMYGYASAFAIARLKKMQLVVRPSLRALFEISTPDQRYLWDSLCLKWERMTEEIGTCNSYAKSNLNFNHSIQYLGCLRSWRYFLGFEDEIRREFTFKYYITRKALKVLHQSVDRLTITRNVVEENVFVGIHVRRGDKLDKSWQDHGLLVPPASYFIKAMEFMRQKYEHVIFVVCSDGMPWAKANLNFTDTVFIEGQTAGVDLAILSQCNHTIISAGTFGWWGGWLANGTTIYYGLPFRPGSTADRQTKMADYMPSHWISMT